MERNDLMQEEEYDRPNWVDKFRSMFSHGDEDDEYEEEYADSAPAARTATRHTPLLRMDHGRGSAIFVRKDYRAMQDAQTAADRLKERRPVIVNFEHVDDDEARRGIDFISGVVYALDGFYEKVGEKVFLFTPSNTEIAVEDTEAGMRTAGPTGLYPDGR
jgi:cell division inhibitor SepF